MAAALAVIAAACGDDKASYPLDTSAGASTSRSVTATTAAPQTGGTLVFGAYSHTTGLDPLVALGSGTSGGIQMAAVYDTLMRYDLDGKQYKPHMLESITPNADSTEYTLKIRAGIKFSDGTDFDAEAVRFALNRHRVGSTTVPATECATYIACPRNSRSSAVYMALVKDIVAVDELTVRVTLSEAWTTFAYALASEPGMIPSPTALKKCDGTKNPNTCDFNLKPFGAGPFTVASFKPSEIIEMVRNPNYFGGQVYLDGVNFVTFLDIGGEKTCDAYKTGTVQGAYLRVPTAVAAAKADKVPGLSLIDQAGETILLNEGVNVNCADGKPEPLCAGKPNGPTPTTPATAKLKVRQAVLAAYDSKTFNERVYQGQGARRHRTVPEEFPVGSRRSGPEVRPRRRQATCQRSESRGMERHRALAHDELRARCQRGARARSDAEGRRYQRDRRHEQRLHRPAGGRHNREGLRHDALGHRHRPRRQCAVVARSCASVDLAVELHRLQE